MLRVIPSYCALQVACAIINWIDHNHVIIRHGRSVTICHRNLSTFTRIMKRPCIGQDKGGPLCLERTAKLVKALAKNTLRHIYHILKHTETYLAHSVISNHIP